MTSWISPQDVWTLWAVIVAGTALSIWLEQTYSWAAKLSGPVIGLAIAMFLSTVHIMPSEAPAYEVIDDYLVPLALPLLLIRANIVRILRSTGQTFIAVNLAAAGTVIGALIAGAAMQHAVPESENAAGIMTASYVGGMVNFTAVKETVQASDAMTSSLIVADNAVMAALFLVLFAIADSLFFRRHFRHPHIQKNDGDAASAAAQHWERKGISLLDLAKGMAFAFVVVTIAMTLKRTIEPHWERSTEHLWSLTLRELLTNRFLLITVVTVLAATILHRPLASINGAEQVGSLFLYLFLFKIGLPADLGAVLSNAPAMFLFCTIMVVANLGLALLFGWLFRLNLEDLLIASNATIGGPATAVAMAVTKGWDQLVLPGFLVGIWGYTIGTPLGLIVTRLLESWHRSS